MPPVASIPLSIEQLKSKYQDLNRKKIEAETRLRDAEERLKKLRAQAESQWGTNDLDELRRKLVDMQTENERRRADYQKDLERIESKLASIDEKYQAAQAEPR